MSWRAARRRTSWPAVCASSGAGGFGDWAGFIQALRPVWAWRKALAVFGGATYSIALAFIRRELQPFIGLRGRAVVPAAQRLCWTPYFCGGLVDGVDWLPALQGAPATQPLPIARSAVCIAAAAVLTAGFTATLGPGLRLAAPFHR